MNLHLLFVLALLFLPLDFAAAQTQSTPLDTLIDIGDYELHFVVFRGETPVTVLFEAGGASDLTSWGDVPARIAEASGATVVVYDRAGLGRSTLSPTVRTPVQELGDLRGAIDRLGVPRRTVVVGTSYGAMIAMLYAADPANDVAGLVLVDPMNAGFALDETEFLMGTVPDIAQPANDREHVIARMKAGFPALIERLAAIELALPQPIAVISAGEPWWGRDDIVAAWRRSHDVLAGAGADRWLVIASGSGHLVPRERPDVIVDTIRRLLGEIESNEEP